jgi:hypothetical protein
MNRKITVLTFCSMLFALCVSVEAQQRGKAPRIGYVSGSGDPHNPGPSVEAFRRGLRDLGYMEGKNILVEYRYAEGVRDRIPGLVAELVRLKLMCLSFMIHPQSTQPSGRPKQLPLLWWQLKTRLRPG